MPLIITITSSMNRVIVPSLTSNIVYGVQSRAAAAAKPTAAVATIPQAAKLMTPSRTTDVIPLPSTSTVAAPVSYAQLCRDNPDHFITKEGALSNRVKVQIKRSTMMVRDRETELHLQLY
jgi:hypothetical protein